MQAVIKRSHCPVSTASLDGEVHLYNRYYHHLGMGKSMAAPRVITDAINQYQRTVGGTYVYKLTVTIDKGLTSVEARVTITVNAAPSTRQR